MLTRQYIHSATEANWLLWVSLLCNLLQCLTKLPLFTTQCSFQRRQTGFALPSRDCWKKRDFIVKKKKKSMCRCSIIYVLLCWKHYKNPKSKHLTDVKQNNIENYWHTHFLYSTLKLIMSMIFVCFCIFQPKNMSHGRDSLQALIPINSK